MPLKRAYYLTTRGVVEVLLLTEEDPIIGRSVHVSGGTTETANIGAAYHAFVARPTGIIERYFAHSCYRLDFSAPVDTGSSWQLGVFIAHALHAAGRLAQEGDSADTIIWATGAVRAVDLTMGRSGPHRRKVGTVDRKVAGGCRERLQSDRRPARCEW